MDYSASWAAAENTVYNALLSATGTIDGRDGFLGGHLPAGIYDLWTFATGGGGAAPAQNNAIVSIQLPATAKALFAERADLQAWCMKVVHALPIRSGNVQTCYLAAGLPMPDLVPVQIARDASDSALLWTATLDLSIVFDCEAAAGDTTPRAPTAVLATRGASPDNVTVTWAASPTATSYSVWRSTVNDFATATRIATGLLVLTSADTTAVAGTSYFYWATATNGTGTSSASVAAEGWRATA